MYFYTLFLVFPLYGPIQPTQNGNFAFFDGRFGFEPNTSTYDTHSSRYTFDKFDGIKNGFSAFLEIVANEYNVEVGAQTAIATGYTQENGKDLSINGFIQKMGLRQMVQTVLGWITSCSRLHQLQLVRFLQH